ncbi:hypothetical protein [Vibrio anguillarum]|uniref:hypothetical protein n=1 Tax=Vibrio anguillarum TaxID=55601 RepID=UPI00188CE439|nr:hypothetical protein [Vibrio anguillarum]
MVDINTDGVLSAFKRLSQSALVESDTDGKCMVCADDLSTVLMALTLVMNERKKDDNE